MKILVLNMQYAKGLNGSLTEYILKGTRYFYLTKKIESKNLKKIQKLINKENPNLACLIEINSNQIQALSENYPFQKYWNKYSPESLLKNSKKSVAMLSKKPLKTEILYFKNGTKRAIVKIYNKNKKIFLVHLSLSKRVREKQFEELKKLIDKKSIIIGDFNTFSEKEIEKTLEITKMKIANKKENKTFPAHNPKKRLDLCLYSKGIKIKRFKVLKEIVSDHKAITFNI